MGIFGYRFDGYPANLIQRAATDNGAGAAEEGGVPHVVPVLHQAVEQRPFVRRFAKTTKVALKGIGREEVVRGLHHRQLFLFQEPAHGHLQKRARWHMVAVKDRDELPFGVFQRIVDVTGLGVLVAGTGDIVHPDIFGKLAKRFQTLAANDNAKAKEIAAWKEEVVAKWDAIEIVSCDKVEDLKNGDIESGKEYTITYVIDEKGLNDAVGLELVTTYTTADGKQHVYSVEPFSVIKKEGNLYTFQVKHSLSNAGSFKVSYRMFPKNPELPHRQDFCYVRWFI